MVHLDMTDQEAAVLRQLIDAAVRALGLKGAEAGLYFDSKIAKAAEAVVATVPRANGPIKEEEALNVSRSNPS